MGFAITTVIAIVALVIAYLTYRAQVAPMLKRLHYASLAFDLVMPVVHDDLRDIFKLYLKGQELINPIVCAARIQNTGRAPIRRDDFDGPLTIQSAEEAAIFRGGLMDCDPANIFDFDHAGKVPFKVMKNKFMISPVLLNPGDKFEIVYIADMVPEKWDVSVSCRIAGLEQVAQVPRIADGMRHNLYVEPIKIPGRETPENVVPGEPNPDRLSLFVWATPMLAGTGGRFDRNLDLRVDNKSIEDPNLLYIIIHNGRKATEIHERRGSVSVDLPGARIVRLIARHVDAASHESNAAQHIRILNSHKISVRIPELESGDTIRVSAVISGSCTDPLVEFRNFTVDEAVLMRFRDIDLIETNLAQLRPKILLSNQRLYRSWLRLCERYRWLHAHF
jgi:hypothetical protein